MNGKDKGNDIYIIIGVIVISIIFLVIIGVSIIILYPNIGATLEGSNSNKDCSQLNMNNFCDCPSSNTIKQLCSESEKSNIENINKASHLAKTLGLPEFIIAPDAITKLNDLTQDTTTKKIINASGISVDVKICNTEGYIPLYTGHSLLCTHGQILIPTEDNVQCCMYPIDLSILPDDSPPLSHFAMVAKTMQDKYDKAPNWVQNVSSIYFTALVTLPWFTKLHANLLNKLVPRKTIVKGISNLLETITSRQIGLSLDGKFKKGMTEISHKTSKRYKALLKKMDILKKIKQEFLEHEKSKFKAANKGSEEKLESEFEKYFKDNRAKLLKEYIKDESKAGEKSGVEAGEENPMHAGVVAGEEAEAEVGVEAGVVAGEEAEAEVGVESVEKAQAKILEKIGDKALEKIATVMLIGDNIATAIEAACTPGDAFGIGEVCQGVTFVIELVFNIAMYVDMAFKIMEKCDPDGFNQYKDNKEDIIPIRDYLEGKGINESEALGYSMPMAFNLIQLNKLSSLNTSTEEDIKNLKDIYVTAQLAYDDYNRLILKQPFRDGQPTEHTKFTIASSLEIHENIDIVLIHNMIRTCDDNPTERDKHMWDFLKIHLNDTNKKKGTNDNELKYLRYVPELSNKNLIAISLNIAGIEIFNDEARRINDNLIKTDSKTEIPIPLLVNSKNYRIIERVDKAGTQEQKYILIQKTLDYKFTLMSYSRYLVESLCTIGIDQEGLDVFNKARQKNYVCKINLAMNKIDTRISPKDCCEVTYNEDTGICNFNKQWCDYMGMDSLKHENYAGSGDTSYKTCDTSNFEEFFSFISETATKESLRH